MKIELVSFKRVRNLGNYETITIEMSASLDGNESPDRVIDALIRDVDRHLFQTYETVQSKKHL